MSQTSASTSGETATEILRWLRDYASKRINSNVIAERRCIPPYVVLDFGSKGLLGLQVRREHGGIALSHVDAVRVLEQLAAIDITLATFVSTHANGVYVIQKYGTPRLQSTFLERLATGREISAFALTEPAAGSNPRAIRARATKDAAGGWTLNGEKYLVDSGSWSSVITTFARTEDAAGGFSAFAVPQAAPGVVMGTESMTTGLRGMVQNTVYFRNAKLDGDSLLGALGEGMEISQEALSISRLNLAGKCIGGLKRCLQLLHRYASRRPIVTGLLWENPLTQSRVVPSVAATSTIERLVHHTAACLDRGDRVPVEAFLACKVAATEELWRTVDMTMQLLGGRGYVDTNVLPHIHADARSFLWSEGPSEALLMYLGSLVMSGPADIERFIRGFGHSSSSAAARLNEVAQTLQDRSAGAPLSEKLGASASFWAASQVGEIAMWAVLTAAAESLTGDEGELATTWARARFEERITRALAAADEWGLGRAALAQSLIGGYEAGIGEQEQSLPGAEAGLDPELFLVPVEEGARADRSLPEDACFESVSGPDAAERLAALAARERVSEPTIRASALAILAHRLSGQDEVSIRLRVEGQADTDVTVDFSTKPTPRAIAQLVHGAMASTTKDDRRRRADTQLELVLASAPAEALRSVAAQSLSVIVDANDPRRATWVYDGRSFGRIGSSRLAARFQELARSWHAHEDASSVSLALLPREERDLVVHRWNQTSADVPEAASVLELFEAQAARTPDRVAVSADDGSVTYRELDDRAERLASRLRAAGVGPEVRVGLCVDRSTDLVVSLLAIWKAGGAYVPLDVLTNPPQRLAMILDDTRLPVIVVTPELAGTLPDHRATTVRTDAWKEGAAERRHRDAGAHAEQCAYVLFTSGSTGRPKGVEVSHRAVLNFLASMQREPGFAADDVLVAVTTISFDIAGLEIYLPLVTGGRVVLASSEASADPAALAALLDRSGATVMQATPATWQMLVGSGWAGRRGLKALCGGDSLPAQLAGAVRERVDSLWNMYGPTETTIWSSVQELTDEPGPITVGRPIANTQMYILDEALDPVPIGAAGELFIGGDGVARGYFRKPELTAERFVPDPFRPGARMYRTGDQARFLADGRVEHLGRLDGQVKIRGFRIEVGEIESVLRAHPGVDEAVVVARASAGGDKRLVGYVIVDAGSDGGQVLTDLQRHVRDRVPTYMVPAALVRLDRFPLTQNGKIDRKALPEPGEDAFGRQDYEAPEGALEAELAELWGEVLGQKSVGRRDDFFSLGGHSLLLASLVGRINKRLQADVRIHQIMGAVTLTEMAARIGELKGSPKREPLRRQTDAGPVPATSAQFPYLFANEIDPKSRAGYNAFDLRIEGQLDVGALTSTLREILARHQILASRYKLERSGYVQIKDPALGEPAVHRLPPLSGEDWAAAEREMELREKEVSLDPSRGPVSRFLLLPVGRERHLLRWLVHHAVADASSADVFVRELGKIYPAFEAGQSPALPALPVQFSDYAVWEASWRKTPEYTAQVEFWRREFVERPSKTVPQNRPGAENLSLDALLDAEGYQALRAVAQRERLTPPLLLLAIYAGLLGRVLGRDELVVLLLNANREHAELFDLIGQFSDALPVRLRIDGARSILATAKQVQEKVRSVLTASGICFHEILRLASFKSAFGPEGLCFASFNMLEAQPELVSTPRLRVQQSRPPFVPYDGLATPGLDLTAFRDGAGLRCALGGAGWQWTRSQLEAFRSAFLGVCGDLARGGASSSIPLRDLKL